MLAHLSEGPRLVAVLDSSVLIPPGLRDLLLSCADAKLFRPVWQSEIENEVRRHAVALTMKRHNVTEADAVGGADHVLRQMNRAFPDARADTSLWVPLVPRMTCDDKDRHVLAVAQGAQATHLLTSNVADFPDNALPPGLRVQGPDDFMCGLLGLMPDLVISAVDNMAARLTTPPRTPRGIAQLMADGEQVPTFGSRLFALLA